jgi:type II secretory pathway pseudopilin PulG
MSTNPYDSPQTSGEPPKRNFGRLAPRLIELLVVLGIIGMLLAFFLPARRTVSESARRAQYGHNLRQIALALQEYESVHHALPPAYTVDAAGKPLHSWRTLILPFLGEQALYEKIDLSKPWDDPTNKAARETHVSTYRCPSVAGPPRHTTYLAVVAPNGCFQSTQPRKLSEITDDRNLTLMVMEVDAGRAVHWMSPSDTTEQELLGLGTVVSLPHPGGAQAVCVSGATLFLRADTTPERLRALLSIAGNDDASARAAE